jgi:transcriptional regulator with XRE-family HTH domain
MGRIYVKTKFGEHIRQLREKKGFKLRELANLVNLSPGYLSQMERNLLPGLPSEETITLLAEYLGADKLELMLLADKLPKSYVDVIKAGLRDNPKEVTEIAAFFRKKEE